MDMDYGPYRGHPRDPRTDPEDECCLCGGKVENQGDDYVCLECGESWPTWKDDIE